MTGLEILCCWWLSAASLETAFQSPCPSHREMTGTRASQTPVIDGVLSEPAWQETAFSGSMTQSFPRPGQPASYPTRIQVMYDDQALYIAAYCADDQPENIIARVTRRDRWIESDWFQVEIDSRLDRRSGYFFAVNAAGVQYDGTLYDENMESADWDGVWEAASTIAPEGWQVEMRIPLYLLRFHASDEVRFGINFVRRISRLNETDQWQYIPPESGLRVSRFGQLNNLALDHPPRHLELTPYLAARPYSDASDTPSRPVDIGADAKVGLGSNFMLTMTANPDFGQVEVDQVVLNLSTIETYFPEKRPFFLEDGNLFRMAQFGDGGPRAELFYTRRIGRAPRSPELDDDEEVSRQAHLPRIWGAAKLAGRTSGRTSIGVLQAVTSEETARVANATGTEEDRVAEPLTSFSILRLTQGFWNNSAFGLMATAVATPEHGNAVTGGSDLQLELFDGQINLTVKTLFSHLSDERFAWQDDFTQAALERDGPDGYGGEIVLYKRGGEHLVGAIGGQLRSTNLALNDMGYLDRPDLLFVFGWMQYRHLQPIGPIARIQVNANAWIYRNTGFLNIGDGGNINGNLQFTNNFNAGFYADFQPASCDDRETRTAGEVIACRENGTVTGSVWLYTDPGRMLSAGIELAAANTERDWVGKASLPLTFHPISRFQLELVPAYRRELGSVRWIDSETTAEGDRHLFAEQHSEYWDVTIRGTLTFTTRLTLQVYSQVFLASVDHGRKLMPRDPSARTIHYRDLVDADHVADDYDYTDTILNLSAVLRWEFLPGSVAYLVYTGSSGQNLEIPDFRFAERWGGLMDQRPEYTLMLKISYLWS